MSELASALLEAGIQTVGASGRSQYSLSYEISPIILTGGIAQNVPGGMIPIISIINSLAFPTGLLSGGGSITLENSFGIFRPMPGGTLIEQLLGKYPFANQTVASNAVITNSLHIALIMHCPARQEGDYLQRLAVITALKMTLDQHNISGGTYTVATPSFLYTNCVMLNLKDASQGNSAQAQNAWLWEFEKPLLTLEQATQAQNALMNRISTGLAVSGDPPSYSGANAAVGNPQSLQGPGTVPAATPLTGASLAGGSQPVSQAPSNAFVGFPAPPGQ